MGKGGLDRYPLAGQDVSAELHLPQALGVCGLLLGIRLGFEIGH